MQLIYLYINNGIVTARVTRKGVLIALYVGASVAEVFGQIKGGNQ